jgi:PAS domain S-box-containing protein
MSSEKKDKVARCEINETGRILNANKKFCKMFGFALDEPMWHYICDLYRYSKDWETFRLMTQEESDNQTFLVRMKNRRGRSFKCSILRTTRIDENGSLIYSNEITRLSDDLKEETDDQVGNFRYLTISIADSRERKLSAVALG